MCTCLQAADALAITGVGRNEYIAALNACKARRLMWRVNINRDSIVREHLPTVSGRPPPGPSPEGERAEEGPCTSSKRGM